MSSNEKAPYANQCAFFHHSGLMRLFLALSLPLTFLSCTQHGNDFPPTEKKPVTEHYGDISFVDNYRWLDSLQDPPVRQWNDAQNAYSRKYFDGVSCLPAVQTRLKELTGHAVSTYYDFWYRTRLFALKEEPPKNQPMIVTFSSVIDTAGETSLWTRTRSIPAARHQSTGSALPATANLSPFPFRKTGAKTGRCTSLM